MIRRRVRPYSTALFETLRRRSDGEAVIGNLEDLGRVIGEVPELAGFFLNPGLPLERKLEALDRIQSRQDADALTRRFAALLTRNYRLALLPEILAGYHELDERARGIERAHVTAATPLDDKAGERLRQALARRLGKDVEDIEIGVATDPGLLGGFVARVGSQVYDASLRGQLERMRRELA